MTGSRPPAARAARAAAFVLAPVLVVACVDLFHDTDFVTLCDRDPSHAACAAEASPAEAGQDAAPHDDAGAPCLDPSEARARATGACARVGACLGPGGPDGLGACVRDVTLALACAPEGLERVGEALALATCLADAKDCGAVERCALPDGLPACPVTETVPFTACSLDAPRRGVAHCTSPDGGRPTRLDACATAASRCATLDPRTAACGGVLDGRCAGEPRCADGWVVRCDGTRDRGFACAGVGAGACAGDAGPACAPRADAPACDEGPEVTCEGDVAVACVAGRRVRLACTHLAARCEPSTAPPSALRPAGVVVDACRSDACTGDTCRGDVALGCAAGVAYEADCTALGLGPCTLTDVDGELRAHCTSP